MEGAAFRRRTMLYIASLGGGLHKVRAFCRRLPLDTIILLHSEDSGLAVALLILPSDSSILNMLNAHLQLTFTTNETTYHHIILDIEDF